MDQHGNLSLASRTVGGCTPVSKSLPRSKKTILCLLYLLINIFVNDKMEVCIKERNLGSVLLTYSIHITLYTILLSSFDQSLECSLL